jgi:F-box and WD-40 domain protein 1/11
MRLIDQLPTSAVCEIVERLSPRLYINFFQYLPPEVCLKILGFLDPISLIHTARASREWMLLALDRKLWEQLYMLEGFRVIRSEIQSFETAINADDRTRPNISDDEHARKRRATPQRILPTLSTDDDYEMVDADPLMPATSSIFGPLTSEPKDSRPLIARSHSDTQVRGMSSASVAPSSNSRSTDNSLPGRTQRLSISSTSGRNSYSRYSGPVSNMSSLVVMDRGDGKKKLNWQYLYSQRRRLEANWEAEKYTNFQLPHPNYPQEAHEECIYTIQHCGKYLVSGSRDKTLRIWNLNTQRLVRPPLRVHNGSVLCLQFDADPNEDLIVSGSSDATVVLWKFSTGQIIQRLRKAHRESVLNVRFDKRVLITCSKDKTIKIFNRRPIYDGDLDVGSSDAVHPVPTFLNNYGFNPSPTDGNLLKQAYSMIGCLEGHQAAVNAVQIYGDEVVSASGDRTVKVWNWRDQTCTRTLIGHTKGIACVQYDGRRIVSGSSDNEVKVFDKESGLEVASLRAHTNLVRTVQAGFGDLPYSSEEDQENAKKIDDEYFRAVDSGAITREMYHQRGRPKNAGSKRPEDITAYGAKLPPGGGGGRFGRIVSGSYDETIIIWRRDKEGVWRAQHTLRQEEAAHSAARAAQRAQAIAVSPQNAVNPQPSAQPVPTATPTAEHTTTTPVPQPAFTTGTDSFYTHLIDLVIPQGPLALRHALQAHPQLLTYQHLSNVILALPPASQGLMSTIVAQAVHSQQGGPPPSGTPQPIIPLPQQSQVLPPPPAASAQPPIQTPPHQPNSRAQSQLESQAESQAQPQTPTSSIAGILATTPTANLLSTPIPNSTLPPTTAPLQTTPQPNPTLILPPATQTAPPAANPAPLPANPVHPHITANMARVFKLQFDARRIICCSQTNIIVGWDFANGDEQIMEASRFFAPIE